MVSPFSAHPCTVTAHWNDRIVLFPKKFASSSVVGYGQTDVINQGGKIISPSFADISSTKIPLSSFVPQGSDTIGKITAQLLDELGRTKDNITYTWVDYATKDGVNYDQTGWMDGDFNLITDEVEVFLGQGIWVTGSAADLKIQNAGKVVTNEVASSLIEGGLMIGNPYPVSITFDDLSMSGDNIIGNVTLQILDELGRTKNNITYTWVDYATKDGVNYDQTGWMDGDFNLITDIEIKVGEGVWISYSQTLNGNDTDPTITIIPPEGF